MKRLHKFLPIVLAAALFSCTKNLEEINRNPNQPENINPQFLLSGVLVSSAYDYQKEAYYDKPASAGRYITLVRNEGNDKFDWGPQNWDGYFAKLSTIKAMTDLAAETKETQYLALGKILRVFNYTYLTDLYGDVPFKEALLSKDENIVHPMYDQQKDIYPALLNELKEANTILSGDVPIIVKDSDMMYEGKVLNWRKFANSLRLRLLLRISKAYPQAFADMQEMLNNKTLYPIFESNADNAEVRYLGANPGDTWPGGPRANAFSEFDKRKPSKEIVDALRQRNDPRLKAWIAPVEQPVGGTVDPNLYVGVPNAIPAPYDYNGGNTHISRLSAMFNANTHDMVKASMLTYAEVCFILAECLQAGKITVAGETAQSMYYKGIRANMKYYGVEAQADTDHYFDQASVKYDGTLKQLIGQKWIAGFLKGAEAWFDYRRTGFPQFVLGPLAPGGIPKRYIYPQSERDNNENQYQKALTVFGEDKQTTLMWYLK